MGPPLLLFNIMKGSVKVMSVGVTTVHVPLYHADNSDISAEIPGRSPLFCSFWKQACSDGGGCATIAGFLRCVWWLLRGLLVAWPCTCDLYFLWKMGGIKSGGSPTENPGADTHAWPIDAYPGPLIEGGIIPDTGGNFLSFPIHLMGVFALWFVGNPRTQIVWQRLVDAEVRMAHKKQMRGQHYAAILVVVAFSIAIFFLRYTHYHVKFWSGSEDKNPIWWSPEMSLNFEDSNPLPLLEVALSVLSEMT